MTALVVTPNFVLIAFDNAGDLFTLDETTAAESLRLDTFFNSGLLTQDLGRVSSSTYLPARNEVWLGLGGQSACRGGASCC